MPTATASPTKPDRNQLIADLADARENLQYWIRQAVVRQDPNAKTEAKALAAAWKTTVAARVADINRAAKP